jgi:uncharacterized protein DUF4160
VQLLHYDGFMPVIHRFFNCAIFINPREHNPPHFHVRMNDGREVLVEIGTQRLLTTEVARREIVEALMWAENNGELLLAKFKEYNP